MISALPLSQPIWIDHHSLEEVAGPTIGADLTGQWDLALEAMDHGLLRLRVIGTTLVVESTEDPKFVLSWLRRLLVFVQHTCSRVRVVNLRTQADLMTSISGLLNVRPPSLAPSLREKPLLSYRFPDICDAATPREQHKAVYGSRLSQDWDRLNLETSTKTLTFAAPAGFPHIRFATRHPVLGERHVYLVVGLQMHEAQDKVEWKHPVAWASPWDGVVWAGGAPQKFDFRDTDLVAEHFGDLDLASVPSLLVMAAHAHGWNKLPFPRAWESAPLPPITRMF